MDLMDHTLYNIPVKKDLNELPEVIRIYQYSNLSEDETPLGFIGNQEHAYFLNLPQSSLIKESNDSPKFRYPGINKLYRIFSSNIDDTIDNINCPAIQTKQLLDWFYVFSVDNPGQQAMSFGRLDIFPICFDNKGFLLDPYGVATLTSYLSQKIYILLDREYFNNTNFLLNVIMRYRPIVSNLQNIVYKEISISDNGTFGISLTDDEDQFAIFYMADGKFYKLSDKYIKNIYPVISENNLNVDESKTIQKQGSYFKILYKSRKSSVVDNTPYRKTKNIRIILNDNSIQSIYVLSKNTKLYIPSDSNKESSILDIPTNNYIREQFRGKIISLNLKNKSVSTFFTDITDFDLFIESTKNTGSKFILCDPFKNYNIVKKQDDLISEITISTTAKDGDNNDQHVVIIYPKFIYNETYTITFSVNSASVSGIDKYTIYNSNNQKTEYFKNLLTEMMYKIHHEEYDTIDYDNCTFQIFENVNGCAGNLFIKNTLTLGSTYTIILNIPKTRVKNNKRITINNYISIIDYPEYVNKSDSWFNDAYLNNNKEIINDGQLIPTDMSIASIDSHVVISRFGDIQYKKKGDKYVIPENSTVQQKDRPLTIPIAYSEQINNNNKIKDSINIGINTALGNVSNNTEDIVSIESSFQTIQKQLETADNNISFNDENSDQFVQYGPGEINAHKNLLDFLISTDNIEYTKIPIAADRNPVIKLNNPFLFGIICGLDENGNEINIFSQESVDNDVILITEYSYNDISGTSNNVSLSVIKGYLKQPNDPNDGKLYIFPDIIGLSPEAYYTKINFTLFKIVTDKNNNKAINENVKALKYYFYS